ncbi:unnamed protein product [Hyaloperonospora brassicae]|nr:unnamed protein product [Hyaloperonospora brassicae]
MLCRGVAKYGTGKWKKILQSGHGVFSKHRTNVDLKDKWKNMQRMNHINRKRTAEGQHLTHHEQSSASVCAKRSRSGDSVSEMSPMDSAELKGVDRTDEAASAMASADEEGTDVSCIPSGKDRLDAETSDPDARGSCQLSGQIALNFVWNRCFPELVNVRVDLDTCKDVSALKQLLRSTVLSEAPLGEEVQMIGLTSRQLLQHDELLSDCIRTNGTDFFLVFDEAT